MPEKSFAVVYSCKIRVYMDANFWQALLRNDQKPGICISSVISEQLAYKTKRVNVDID